MNQDAVKYIDDLILSSETEYELKEDDSIYVWWYNTKGTCLMFYDYNRNHLSLSYGNLLSILESEFGLNEIEINELMNNRMMCFYKKEWKWCTIHFNY